MVDKSPTDSQSVSEMLGQFYSEHRKNQVESKKDFFFVFPFILLLKY